MQILNGHKSGGGLLFLSDDREIERDNLWAIRGLLAAVFLNAAVQPSASGPAWAVGLLAALFALYWARSGFSHAKNLTKRKVLVVQLASD